MSARSIVARATVVAHSGAMLVDQAVPTDVPTVCKSATCGAVPVYCRKKTFAHRPFPMVPLSLTWTQLAAFGRGGIPRVSNGGHIFVAAEGYTWVNRNGQ